MMVINWERIGRIAGKSFLFFLEYCIKLSAFVVTAVVLSAKGSFGTKLGTGFSSISPSLRSLFEAPGEIVGAAATIHDYNTMTEAAFNVQYGANAIHNVLAYLDGGIVYVNTVMSNFGSQPFATFFAAIISFWSLYMISLVLRFARQKGQGSYFNKLERKLSDRIYETSRRLTKPVPEVKPETNGSSINSKTGVSVGTHTNGSTGTSTGNKRNVGSGMGKRSAKSFKKAQQTNKYLQDYMKSVQNG